MKHQIAVGIMTAPKIEAIIPGPHSTPEHPTFLLKNVRIGIGFHWDRLEDQEFEGTLEIRDNADADILEKESWVFWCRMRTRNNGLYLWGGHYAHCNLVFHDYMVI